MKALLNDGLEKEGLKLFQDAGVETDTQKRDQNKLIADMGQFDALIVRSATKSHQGSFRSRRQRKTQNRRKGRSGL